jgi:hypothetical protein
MKTQPGSLALWAALALLGCSSSSTSFTAKATTTGKNPHFVALADFNNDGKLDVAVANNGDGTVEVQFGNGGGGFGSPVRYKAGSGPMAVAAGDLDGDGWQDLASANWLGDTFSVFRNQGDGSFAATQNIEAEYPLFVQTADFAGDGKAELLMIEGNGDAVSVRPAPWLSTRVGNRIDCPSAQNTAVADFDRDGTLDVAVANNVTGLFTVLFSAGEPAKTRVRTFEAVEPWALTAGDFNRDGATDLAFVAASANPNVAVYLNDGAGNFTLHQTYPVANHGWHIATGDVNADGLLDLAVANNGSDTVALLQGHGDGTFTLAATLPTGRSPTAVALGDLDGDGKDDLVVANYQADSLSVLLSR